MKRYLYTAQVKSASGFQTFYVDANSRQDADGRVANDDTDGIYMHAVEVTDLEDFEFEGETTVADFGDFAPERADQFSGACDECGGDEPGGAHEDDSVPASLDHKPPYDNCSFLLCDLPGQCRGEGKCHHPARPACKVRGNADASTVSGEPVAWWKIHEGKPSIVPASTFLPDDAISCGWKPLGFLESPQSKQQVNAASALKFAAQVVELYDDATMRDDHMIDSGECAGILNALADYFTRIAPQIPEGCSKAIATDLAIENA